MNKIAIVIPAYNEEERLPIMLNQAISYLTGRERKDKDFTYEIIIVDDGSSDKTYEVALEFSRKYTTNIV